MTLAEKVSRAKADYDAVYAAGQAGGGDSGDYDDGYEDGYDEGYAKGEADGYTKGQASYAERDAYIVSSTNSELESVGVSAIEGVLEIPSKIDEVYDKGETDGYAKGHIAGVADGIEQGKQAEYDAFWDAYQDYGNRTDYSMLFGGPGWTTETFQPKYLIKPGSTGNHYMMFARTGVEVLDERVLDTSQATAFSMSFYNSSKLRSITIDLSSLTALADTFNYDSNLETVVLKNVPETCNFTGGFNGCSKLENFTVTGVIGGTALNLSWSSLLTGESVRCIIEHLKDRTGTTAATITFHNTVGGKLTQAQKDAISAKNWTLAY